MTISAALHALPLLFDFAQTEGRHKAESSPLQIGYVSRSLDDFRPPSKAAVTAEVVEPTPQPSKPLPAVSSGVSAGAPKVKQGTDHETPSKRDSQPAEIKKPSPKINTPAAAMLEKASEEKGRTGHEPAMPKPEPQPPQSRSEIMKQRLQVSVPSLSLPEVAEPSSVQRPPEAEVGAGAARGVSSADPAQDRQRKKNAPEENAAAGESTLNSPAAPEYQSALPRYKINPKPDYPRVARDRGWEGRVLFRVEVLKTGEVGALTLVASSGYRSLDRAAGRAVRRWRFKPATVLGSPVASEVKVPIEFALER